MINYFPASVDVEASPPHRALMVMGCVCGLPLTWTLSSVLQTKVHEVVILVVLLVLGGGSLVSHLVSPLLHGLHDLLHDGRLGDGAGGRGHEGRGLGQAEAVGHGGGDVVGVGHVGGAGHRVGGQRHGGGGHGGGGGVPGGVGVGQGAVEEDLGLGRGGGKSENNLHRAHGETHYWTLLTLTKRGTYRLQHGCDGWFGWWTLTKEPGQGAAL